MFLWRRQIMGLEGMKSNTNCHRALNMKHHWFQLCWFSAAVGFLTDPLWSNAATTAATTTTDNTWGVFFLGILRMYSPNRLEGHLLRLEEQKWRMGSIISSSSSTKHNYYFHMVVCHICVNPIQASDVALKTLTLSPATPLCPTWPSSPCGYGCVSQECRENDWIWWLMVTDALLTLGPSSPGEPGGPVGPSSPWEKGRKGIDHIFYFRLYILK